MSIPAYFFYWSGNASNLSEYRNVKWALAAFSLGNIGQCKLFRSIYNYLIAGVACNSGTLNDTSIHLSCPYGSLNSIVDFG